MASIDHRCSRLCAKGPRASNGELLDRDSEEQEKEHCDCESDHLVLHSRCAVDVRTPLSDAAYASEWDKQPRRGDEMPWRADGCRARRLVCVASRSPLGASRRTGFKCLQPRITVAKGARFVAR